MLLSGMGTSCLFLIAYNVQVEFTVINFTLLLTCGLFPGLADKEMSFETGHTRLYELKGMNVMATFLDGLLVTHFLSSI